MGGIRELLTHNPVLQMFPKVYKNIHQDIKTPRIITCLPSRRMILLILCTVSKPFCPRKCAQRVWIKLFSKGEASLELFDSVEDLSVGDVSSRDS